MSRDGKEVLVQGSPEKKKTVRFDGNEIDLAKEELMKDPDHKVFINNPPTMMGNEKLKMRLEVVWHNSYMMLLVITPQRTTRSVSHQLRLKRMLITTATNY